MKFDSFHRVQNLLYTFTSLCANCKHKYLYQESFFVADSFCSVWSTAFKLHCTPKLFESTQIDRDEKLFLNHKIIKFYMPAEDDEINYGVVFILTFQPVTYC